jgi:uncharacterized protein (TIGR04255 family)
MDLNDICYQQNFIDNVIFRVDFGTSVMQLNSNFPQQVRDSLKAVFPVSEIANIQKNEIQVDSNGKIITNPQQINEWNFFSQNRNKRLAITQDSVLVEYKKEAYDKFETLLGEIELIKDHVFTVFSENVISRLGLRYINNISIKDIRTPVDWDQYIVAQYTSPLKIFDPNTYMRAITIIETDHNDYKSRIQYGVFNPDYPAKVVKKQFLIDIDAYSPGLIYANEVIPLVNKLHTHIQSIFEQFITVALREKMNNG